MPRGVRSPGDRAVTLWSKAPEVLGLLGSMALAVPSLRHAWSQWRYKQYWNVPSYTSATAAFDSKIQEQMERRARRAYWWDPWDSGSLFFGSMCLVASFAITLCR